MQKKIIAVLLSFLLIFSLVSCGKTEEDKRTAVVCLEYFSYDWARNIIGDDDSINLILLNRTGKDMHSFEPSVQDLAVISGADLVVCLGGISEEWLIEFAEKNGVELFMLMDAFLESDISSGYELDPEDIDEHIFLSTEIPVAVIPELEEAITGVMPEKGDIFRANSEKYCSMISELGEADFKGKHVIVADRYPFEYLSDDLGFTFAAAFDGCSSETEASFSIIVELAEELKNSSVNTVFILENSDKKLAEQIIFTSGRNDVKIEELNSVQSVSEKDIENGITYYSLLKEDIEKIGSL